MTSAPGAYSQNSHKKGNGSALPRRGHRSSIHSHFHSPPLQNRSKIVRKFEEGTFSDVQRKVKKTHEGREGGIEPFQSRTSVLRHRTPAPPACVCVCVCVCIDTCMYEYVCVCTHHQFWRKLFSISHIHTLSFFLPQSLSLSSFHLHLRQSHSDLLTDVRECVFNVLCEYSAAFACQHIEANERRHVSVNCMSSEEELRVLETWEERGERRESMRKRK